MEKITFVYNRESDEAEAEVDDDLAECVKLITGEAVIFSPCTDYSIKLGTIAHKFENMSRCFKSTGERWLEITSKVDADIPDGIQGELALYETVDSGLIWQASFDGREPTGSKNEWVYKFSGMQA